MIIYSLCTVHVSIDLQMSLLLLYYVWYLLIHNSLSPSSVRSIYFFLSRGYRFRAQTVWKVEPVSKEVYSYWYTIIPMMISLSGSIVTDKVDLRCEVTRLLSSGVLTIERPATKDTSLREGTLSHSLLHMVCTVIIASKGGTDWEDSATIHCCL